MNLKAVLEGLLFVVGDEGLSLEELMKILEINKEQLDDIINELKNDYNDINRGLSLAILGNHLKLITKKEHNHYFQKMVDMASNESLSVAALETLAIIAYNQPITRVTIDEVRGVSSAHLVRKLCYRNLIDEIGRSESAGRPILYGTTDLFLDYFGLKSIDDLPNIEIESNDSVLDLYNSKYKE